MARYTHAIKIEGLGDVSASTATDKRYRYCYGRQLFDDIASADPDDLFVDGLLMWPQELSADVDFRDGRATLSTQTFTLRATAQSRGDLYRLRHGVSARLIAAMTSSQTTIDVTASGLDGVYTLERERIDIDGSSQSTITGGFRYTCTRGVLSTLALPHTVGVTSDVELFATLHTHAGRVVQLVRIPLDATNAYTEEVVLWSGVLREVSTDDTGLTLALNVDSILNLVEDQAILADRSQGELTAAWLDPRRPRSNRLGFAVIANEAPASGSGVSSDPSEALYMLGDDAVIRGTYTAVDMGAYTYLRFLADAQSFAGRAVPEDLSVYSKTATREVFTTRADAPSNVDSGSVGDNTLPLSSHPGKLILQLLTTTRNDGAAGPNGSYDTGVNALAGSIPASLVDTDGILAWGDEIGVTFDNLFLGDEDGPVSVSQLMQKLLTPLLSALVATREGKLTVVRLRDSAEYGSSLAITQSQVRAARIVHTRNLVDALDRVTLTYNAEPGLQPATISARDTIKYKRQPPGQHGSMSLALPGVRRRDVATQVVQAVIQRYHDPIPILSLECLPTVQLELGDVASVTHDLIPAGDGTRGRTSAPMLVVSRQEVFSGNPGEAGEHVTVYGLLDVGLIHPRDGWIAPSGRVAESPSPTTTVFTLEATDFSGSDGPLDADVDGFDASDFIDLLDQYGTPRDTGLKISGVSGNQITLVNAASVTPAAGDIIRPSAYAQCNATQRDDWTFVADANDLLNTDDPKTYRS